MIKQYGFIVFRCLKKIEKQKFDYEMMIFMHAICVFTASYVMAFKNESRK